MVDPVGSVKQVLQVALKIKEAVDTVRSNKEVCHQIRGRVNRLRAILSKLEDADADAVDDPATADTLKDLEETLHRAYSLVAACQEDRNMVSLLFSAGKLSRNLRQVNEDILAQMAIASFGNNVRTTIMLTKYFQDSPKGDAEHAMSWYGTRSHHGTRVEASDKYGGVLEVEEPSIIPKMPDASLPWFIIFTYTQLRNATHDFSFELGRGSSAVIYKGILSDGREVAVKRIYLDTTSCNEVYEKEVRFTAMLQHVNVMKLIGCCSTEGESFQVYELMHNGTLGDHIHGTIKDSGLPWPVRFQIIQGIAQGLLYLHQQCGLRIVHMDIKPNNILLDDDYIPKITDFGISEVLSALAHEEETGVVRGTPGFVDPELATNRRFSAKTDVYGYGVLLLETISGKSCIQADSDFNILSAWAWYLWKERKLAEFIDPRVRGVANVSETKEIKRCIHIALLCIELNPADRPTMSDILQMLWDNKLKLPAPQNPAGTNEVS